MQERAAPRRLFFTKTWWMLARVIIYISGAMAGLVFLPAVLLDPRRSGSANYAATIPLFLLGFVSAALLWRTTRRLAGPRSPRIAIYREGLLFRKPNRVLIQALEADGGARGREFLQPGGIDEGRVAWSDLGEVRARGWPFYNNLSFQIHSTLQSGGSEGAVKRVRISVTYSDRLQISARRVRQAIAFYCRNEAARLALPTWDVTSLAQTDAPPVGRRLRIRTIMLVVLAVALWAAMVRGCADMMHAAP